MPRIEDPDDYEARQRVFETAGDEFMLDWEAWDADWEAEEPQGYSDGLVVPKRISRDGYYQGVFRLGSPALCIKCRSWIAVRTTAMGRKQDGRWLIQHLGDCPARISEERQAVGIDEASEPERFGHRRMQSSRPTPLGHPCLACQKLVRPGENLKFDVTRAAFIHVTCVSTSA